MMSTITRFNCLFDTLRQADWNRFSSISDVTLNPKWKYFKQMSFLSSKVVALPTHNSLIFTLESNDDDLTNLVDTAEAASETMAR